MNDSSLPPLLSRPEDDLRLEALPGAEVGLLPPVADDAPVLASAGDVGVWSLLALLVWSVSGVLVARVHLRRRTDWPYLVLGALFGPLYGPVLSDRRSALEAATAPVWLSRGTPRPGEVDVIIATEAGTEARALASSAIDLLGGSIHRLAFVRLVDAALMDGGWSPETDEAALSLEVDALSAEGHDPAKVLVAGRDLGAIERFARAEGFSLIVAEARMRDATGGPSVPTLRCTGGSGPGLGRARP